MATNITIKGIPDEIYLLLKERAEKNHRSVNSEVIFTLKNALQSKPFNQASFMERARTLKSSAKGQLAMEDIEAYQDEGRP